MPVKKALVLARELEVFEGDDNFNFLTGDSRARTISGGVLNVDGCDWYRMDTEAAAALDQLDRVTGTTTGALVTLYITSASRKISVVHGTYLKLQNNGATFNMDTTNDNITFRSKDGTVLVEEHRASVPE